MTTSVGTTSSGTTYTYGTASGLNTSALIANAKAIKLTSKTRVDDQISTNTKKISAYQELQTEAQALKSNIDKLKYSSSSSSAFDLKKATTTSSDSSVSASSVLTATVTADAQVGTHTIEITQDARAFSALGSVTESSTTTALGFAGTFDIGAAGKTASTITVSATTTLQGLVDAINATTSTSGVTADILQSASGAYQLVIRGADTGKAVSVSNVTGTNVLNSLGVTNSSNAFTNITQAARSAIIVLDNTTITSTSNTFTNVLSGLTIDALSSAAGTTITLSVSHDTTSIQNAIQNFVTTYNTLHDTIAANQKVGSDGTVDSGATLFNELLNKQLGKDLSSLTTTTYGSSSSYNGLSSLGITLDENNHLAIDFSVLTPALTGSLSTVEAIFQNSSSTGLADKLSTLLDKYSNSSTGSIATQILSLQTTNTTLTQKSDDLQTAADDYESSLVEKYAKMETLVKSAQTLTAQVQAILKGSTNSNN